MLGPRLRGRIEAGCAAQWVRAGSGVPALPSASCVTLGELLCLSLPLFTHHVTWGFVRSKRGTESQALAERLAQSKPSVNAVGFVLTLGGKLLRAEILSVLFPLFVSIL